MNLLIYSKEIYISKTLISFSHTDTNISKVMRTEKFMNLKSYCFLLLTLFVWDVETIENQAPENPETFPEYNHLSLSDV